MTLDQVRSRLNDRNLSHTEWIRLKKKETTLVGRRLTALFNAASKRTARYSDFKQATNRAFELVTLRTMNIGGEYLHYAREKFNG